MRNKWPCVRDRSQAQSTGRDGHGMHQEIGRSEYNGVVFGRIRNGHHSGVCGVIWRRLRRALGVAEQGAALPSARRVQVGGSGQRYRRRRRTGLSTANNQQ